MDNALLRFCLTEGFTGSDHATRVASDADLAWLRDVLRRLDSESELLINNLTALDGYCTEALAGTPTSIPRDEALVRLDEVIEFVEDINYADDFIKLKGLQFVIRLLKVADEEVRIRCWWLLQAVVQSNPKAQNAVLNHDALWADFVADFVGNDVGTRVFAKTLSFFSAFVDNNADVQKKVLATQTVLDKINAALQSKNEAIVDRLRFALRKFEDPKMQALGNH